MASTRTSISEGARAVSDALDTLGAIISINAWNLLGVVTPLAPPIDVRSGS
jgi:hypothetical protein